MKIAVASRAVAPLHGRGGLERAVADGCAALAARGHEVTLFTATATASAPHETIPFAVVQVSWGAVPGLKAGGVLDRATHYGGFVRRLTTTIAATENTYDAAIGHGAAAAAFVPLVRSGQVRRFLVNPHGMEEFAAPPMKRLLLRGQQALVRRAAGTADRVIATDTALVPVVMRYLRLPQGRVVVVPNGVNLAALDAFASRDMPRESEAAPLLVSVGRIEANKGLDILVAALTIIQSDLPPNWQWVHVGQGSVRVQIERQARAAGLIGHVRFPGGLPDADLHALLARATLFVHSARYEGSSLVTLEAMAHRLPVVATAVGGIPDKVMPGETGWLVQPGNASALGNVLLTAIRTTDATRHAMGERGRARVERLFSLDTTTDALLDAIAAIPAR